MPGLQLQVTANTQQATTQVNNLSNSLGTLSNAATNANTATNLLSQASVNAARANAAAAASIAANARATAANTSSTQQATTAANQLAAATSNLNRASDRGAQALQNVGRVAQDLPFGFIGIQNNLNPLLESFQRLRAETGSAGGALRALGSSLVGVGGIGLALSVASAAFLIFQNGIAGFNKKTKEAKNAADELSESEKILAENTKTLTKYQEEYAKTSGKELAGLQILRGVIEDVNRPMDVRLNAIRDLQKEFPEYFKGLSNEALLTGKVSEAYDRATESIIRKSKANAAQKEVEKIFDEVNKLEIERVNKNREYYDKLGDLQKKAQAAEAVAAKDVNRNSYQLTTIFNSTAGARAIAAQEAVADLKKNFRIQDETIADEITKRKRLADEFIKIAIGNTDVSQSDSKLLGIIGKIEQKIKDLKDIQPSLLSEKEITENVKQIKILEDELDRLLGRVKKSGETVNTVLAKLSRQIALLSQQEIELDCQQRLRLRLSLLWQL